MSWCSGRDSYRRNQYSASFSIACRVFQQLGAAPEVARVEALAPMAAPGVMRLGRYSVLGIRPTEIAIAAKNQGSDELEYRH